MGPAGGGGDRVINRSLGRKAPRVLVSALYAAGMPSRTRGPAVVLALLVATAVVSPVPAAGAAAGGAGDALERAVPAGAEGTYVPIDPLRVVDTRSGLGGRTGKLGQQEYMTFNPALGGAVPTSGVSAVLLNVTGTEPTHPTHIRVWPTGSPLPGTSSVNLERGQSRPNQVVVPVGPDGRVALFNNTGSTHLVVDVQGFYSKADGEPGGGYHPTNPYRVLDTRDDDWPLEPREVAGVYVSAPGVDWATVTAVDVNLTVTEPTTPGHITAWPGDGPPPSVSNVNFAPGQTVANHAVVPVMVDPDGEPYIVVRNSNGYTHFIVDVLGWYDDGSRTDGLRFTPSRTSRVADTRSGSGRVAAGGSLVVPGSALPPAALAHVVNITSTEASGPGHLTTWNGTGTRPSTSTVNYTRGEDSPNLATVGVGPDGRIAVGANTSPSHVVVDHLGYFW